MIMRSKIVFMAVLTVLASSDAFARSASPAANLAASQRVLNKNSSVVASPNIFKNGRNNLHFIQTLRKIEIDRIREILRDPRPRVSG
jgi:hypothetical protein